MRQAISDALMEEMDRDPKVFIMGEEVGVWGGTYAVTKGFYDKYGPERVKDTPIAENAIIGGAITFLGDVPVGGNYFAISRHHHRDPRPFHARRGKVEDNVF